MSENLLDETLAMIAREYGGRFERSADLAQHLAQPYSERESVSFAWRLYADIPTECPENLVADLFSLLIYNTRDNGRSICEWARIQLTRAENLRRVRIALDSCSWGVNPFLQEEEMKNVIANVVAEFPEAADECRKFVESWYLSWREVRYPRFHQARRGFEGAGE